MKIGELSRLTGVSIRSLRYYEKQGLIAPARLTNGYRDFSPLTEETVKTIKLYLNLGLTTEQVAGFLNCVLQNKEAFCTDVMPIYQQKLEEIERQIIELNQIKANLLDRIAYVQLEAEANNE
ncbi:MULTISPECIES: MerR family transcriptional regulator [Paenibacillus]|uniref:MerR family transcriptional regulator n=1 Tax=Paenibacillus radicis (ex Xue et al. 2023) TaxID=2972489 RepID=A0ABT1YPR8_9BACL|nr:MerR family transcriptional regulator [Paenibacillus radicis (ex Xue et al. 2023)]MCR8635184.1 MerR family transcriptional regulator [Paenibacillus radicis (ex Xue et al. 2023)]